MVHGWLCSAWLGLATLLLTACGTTTVKPAASSSPYGPRSSPATVSRCMRANGVSNFPDPTSVPGGGVGFNGLFMSNTGTLIVDGTTFDGPAVLHAEKVCAAYLPGGAGPPPQLSADQKRRVLANASCMRKHGVPNFPDPQFPGTGGVLLKLPAGVNFQSRAFQQAAAACRTLGAALAVRR